MNENEITSEQILAILKQRSEGATEAGLCRQHGIPSQTLWKWIVFFDGKSLDEIEQIRQDQYFSKLTPARRLARQAFVEINIDKMRRDGHEFIITLAERQADVENDIALYAELKSHGAYFEHQLKTLQWHRAAILDTKERAQSVLKMYLKETPSAPHDNIKWIWDDHIAPLVRAEQIRLLRAWRLKRPMMVDKQQKKAEGCKERRADALAAFVQKLSDYIQEGSRLSKLWRWMTCDEEDGDAIWLYHHEDFEKWKCIHFRIRVDAVARDLLFTIESYINFNYGKDPTQYKYDSSSAYDRPDWIKTTVRSHTLSTSSAVSEQQTLTFTKGASRGETVTDSQGKATSTSASRSRSASRGKSVGRNESSSWSNSSSYSFPANSYGRSFSFGGSEGCSWGANEGATVSTTDGASQTENVSTARATQQGSSESISRAVSAGFSCTDGKSVQLSYVAYGPDWGLSNKEHLKQWRDYNPEAAEIFDQVQELFAGICDELIKDLPLRAKGAGDQPVKTLDAVIARIATLIPVIKTKTDELIRPAALDTPVGR